MDAITNVEKLVRETIQSVLIYDDEIDEYKKELPTMYGEILILNSTKTKTKTFVSRIVRQKDDDWTIAFDMSSIELIWNDTPSLNRVLMNVPQSFINNLNNMATQVGIEVTPLPPQKIHKSNALLAALSMKKKPEQYDLITSYRILKMREDKGFIGKGEAYSIISKYMAILRGFATSIDYGFMLYLFHLYTTLIVANYPIKSIVDICNKEEAIKVMDNLQRRVLTFLMDLE